MLSADIIYDYVFKAATNDNMDAYKLKFSVGNQEYILWEWHGDYLNLGSGAEIGLYTNPHYFEVTGTDYPIPQIKHWDAVDYNVPLKLYLYNKDNGVVDNIFRWEPYEEQWWITGFNPNYEPVMRNQIMIGSLELWYKQDLYYSLKEAYSNKIRDENEAYLYFDDNTKTVWIQWSVDALR